jgi:hypothetical protein
MGRASASRCSSPGFRLAIVVIFGLGAKSATAEVPDSVGLIHFEAPAGWKAVDQPGKSVRMYVPPNATPADQALIIVAIGDAGGEFRAQFDQLVNSAMASRKVMKAGQVRQGRSRQGFTVLSENLTAEGDNGMMMLARFVAADVNGRPALLCYIATLPDAYELHHGELDKMLASVTFGDSPPMARATDHAKTPAAAADDAAAKSPEQWAREADKRRKAHTVLGDILDRQGKPAKGLKGYVYIGGTTIRGDRSSYQLDLDENGHFEMVVPDGVYRLTTSLNVEYDGKLLPVQLMAMDAKSPGQSFSSAEGVVRDYRWVLLGRRPGTDGDSHVNYFGAHLNFSDAKSGDFGHQLKDRWPVGTKLRVALSPAGPLIDGSEGRPMGFEMDLRSLVNLAQPAGASVPIGVYKVAAEFLTPEGKRQRALLSLDPGGTQRAAEVEIHFTRGAAVDDVNDVSIWFGDNAG